MRPDPSARPEYIEALREIAALPIKMYVAGGVALHLHASERVSEEIDAVFSRRIALPENLEVAYLDADGAARPLYFDRQYSVALALIHEVARRKLIRAAALQVRAEQAPPGYVGSIDRIQGNIFQACRIVEDTERRHSR